MITEVILAVIGATATIVAALIAVLVKRDKDKQWSETYEVDRRNTIGPRPNANVDAQNSDRRWSYIYF